jgi:hypothetical protein
MRRVLLALLTLFAIGCGDDGGNLVLTGEDCETTADCDDGRFCNGEEVCLGGKCAELNNPPNCDDGIDCTTDSCSEEYRECFHEPPDVDGDGVADAACRGADGLSLGSDCEDTNPNRYPGNVEVCDNANIDEDCDPSTFGAIDDDGDGLFDADCCNFNGVSTICGSDCDDSNPAIVPGAQICSGGQNPADQVEICQGNGQFQIDTCDSAQTCIAQPNGLGVCVPN